MEKQKLTIRQWFSLILIGFVGQLAWVIENNQINVWIFSQTHHSEYITWMTMASAVAATLTTFFMGALSDRLGKRKLFICIGYILWGGSVVAFGAFSYGRMLNQFQNADAAILAIGLFMTIIDCVMTFFGSTANDACFNAYVTDVTVEKNRGKVESILSVLPLFANIVMIVAMQLFNVSAGDTQSSDLYASAEAVAPNWLNFFLAFGVIVTAIGIIAIFLMPKDEAKPNRGNYWAALIYGFRPSVIKSHKNFYIALLAFMAFNCAMDAFMPYYMVYFQNDTAHLGLNFNAAAGTGDLFTLTMLGILVAASAIVIVVGLFMDKIGKLKLLLPGLGLAIAGFIGMYFANYSFIGSDHLGGLLALVIIAGVLMMSGYLIGTAVLGATVRDETPKEEVGLFQGVRMIFAVMLPMIIGSYVSLAFFQLNGVSYVDTSTGTTSPAPTNVMFLVALGFIVIAIAPTLWLLFSKKKAAASLAEDTRPQA